MTKTIFSTAIALVGRSIEALVSSLSSIAPHVVKLCYLIAIAAMLCAITVHHREKIVSAAARVARRPFGFVRAAWIKIRKVFYVLLAASVFCYVNSPAFTVPAGTSPSPVYIAFIAYGGSAASNFVQRFGHSLNAVDDFGADPTGAADSSVAINNAAAAFVSSATPNVILPAGTFTLTNDVVLNTTTAGSQCLIGQGWNTILHIPITFNPSQTGVIKFTPNSAVTGVVRPCVKNLAMVFDQPSDLNTTAAAAQTAGNNTVTVASATGISVGMVAADVTNQNAIPSPANQLALAIPTVTAISGNVLTLSVAVASPGISSGDTLAFSPTRANFLPIGSCSLAPGSGWCKYPWAINGPATVNYLQLDDILIENAWNGVYERGSNLNIGLLIVGAMNVGLDIDQSLNETHVDNYQFFPFGLNPSNNQVALGTVYYDGATVAANIGRMDGITINAIQSWSAVVNITTNWTFGFINQLELDGNNADLNILSSVSGGFLLIDSFYSTKGPQTEGSPLYQNAGHTNFDTEISNFNITSASAYNPAVVNDGGILNLKGGYAYNLQQSSYPFFEVISSLASLNISNALLDSSVSRNTPFISQTAGDLILGSGIKFKTPPAAGAYGVVSSAFSSLSSIDPNIAWNGWGLSGLYPPNSGSCAVTAQKGLNTSGSFTASGSCAGGTYILTFSKTAPTGWICQAGDLTTTADTLKQSGLSQTSVTFISTVAASDNISFSCSQQ